MCWVEHPSVSRVEGREDHHFCKDYCRRQTCVQYYAQRSCEAGDRFGVKTREPLSAPDRDLCASEAISSEPIPAHGYILNVGALVAEEYLFK